MKARMTLLFVCTHNACRSILAESIAKKIGDNFWQVASAGSHPAGSVHPSTLAALTQQGYPTTDLKSKSWHQLEQYAPTVVITVCDQAAGESCPFWLGKAVKGHWALPDPSKIQNKVDQDKMFEEVIRTLETRLTALAEGVAMHTDQAALQLQIDALGRLS